MKVIGGRGTPAAIIQSDMENNAAKIVSSAIIGADVETITVNGKRYVIMPPTIKKIAGAAYWLSDIKEAKTLKEMFMSINNAVALAHALSWFINGNDDLFSELSNGTQDEVIKGLEVAYSLISTQNFIRLSILARNVANLTATPKP